MIIRVGSNLGAHEAQPVAYSAIRYNSETKRWEANTWAPIGVTQTSNPYELLKRVAHDRRQEHGARVNRHAAGR